LGNWKKKKEKKRKKKKKKENLQVFLKINKYYKYQLLRSPKFLSSVFIIIIIIIVLSAASVSFKMEQGVQRQVLREGKNVGPARNTSYWSKHPFPVGAGHLIRLIHLLR